MSGKQRVVVAMSGGVDSAVAAALLVEQGFEVVGISLKLLSSRLPVRCTQTGAASDTERPDRCCSAKDVEDARLVATQIGIAHYVLNYEQQFHREVIQEFTEAYLGGLTPNPCVRCNGLVKFGSLLRQAVGLGAEILATGHYARVDRDSRSGRHLLRRGSDHERDQSYFLYSLTQAQLARVRFPIGRMTKEQVRERAAAQGLRVAAKADSQDLCFVGRDYRAFLRERCGDRLRPGPITDSAGRMLGQHEGLALYTVGQRNGLGMGGGPFYVVRLDPKSNAVVVGKQDELLRQEFVAEALNLVAWEDLTEERPVLVKVRSRQAALPATILPQGDGRVRVRWREAQPIPAPGQAAVFYDASEPDLLAGGATVAADQEVQ